MNRVLSLILLAIIAVGASAQDLIVPKQGDPIKSWNLEISDKYVFYTTQSDENSQIQRISKDNILVIRRADGTTVDLTSGQGETAISTATEDATQDFPVINEKDIHGSLIAEGNCVFIPTDSPMDYERAGQQRLKEWAQRWGFWKVVAKPEQAHFVLQFTTQTSGEDFSYIIIRPRKYYAEYPTVRREMTFTSVGWTVGKGKIGITPIWVKSNENINDNIRNAELLGENLKRMILEPNSREGKKFIDSYSKYLDADSESNNHPKVILYAR